jgi:hypothetical protein
LTPCADMDDAKNTANDAKNAAKDAFGIEREEKDKPVGEQVKDAVSSDDPEKKAAARAALKDEAKDAFQHAKESVVETAHKVKESISHATESKK